MESEVTWLMADIIPGELSGKSQINKMLVLGGLLISEGYIVQRKKARY